MSPPDHAVLRDRVGTSGIVLLPVEVESWNVKSRAARHGARGWNERLWTSAKNLPAVFKKSKFFVFACKRFARADRGHTNGLGPVYRVGFTGGGLF